jgi:hypothetical protein
VSVKRAALAAASRVSAVAAAVAAAVGRALSAKRAALAVAVVLTLLGALCVAVRNEFGHKALMAPGDSFWQLSYTVGFHARMREAEVKVLLPLDTRHVRVHGHKTEGANLIVNPALVKQGDTRYISVKASRTGVYHLTTQILIHLSQRPGWRENLPEANLNSKARSRALGDERGIEVSDPVVEQTLSRLRDGQGSKEELVERLFRYCSREIGLGGNADPQEAAEVLSKGVASPLGCARALVALCRAAKVPARLVTGFDIRRGDDVHPHTWVEVLLDGAWESYDPADGYSRELPTSFVPVLRDGLDIVHSRQAGELTAKYAITPTAPPAGVVDLEGQHLLDILDLNRLPLQIHHVLMVILLLPLGGLVTAVVRTIIGLRTFGTFTPTLLALAFVFNDWRMGVLVLLAVIVLGFSSRAFLDRLKLLLVPRLGIILTLVVLCMVFSVSALDYFGRTPGAQTVLLPMVILTMLVERFYVTSEEDSLAFAAQLLVGTLALAFVVYKLLNWETVGRTLFIYPELHLFTVAALILVGRYTGYRLTELWRFRDLAGPKP